MDALKTTDTAATVAPRKPYAKPAFSFERVFETTALACWDLPPDFDNEAS